MLFPVVFIGQLAVRELHGLAFGHEHDFNCILAWCVYGRGSAAGLCFLFSHSCSYSNSAFATGCGDSGPSPKSVPSIVLPFSAAPTSVPTISLARRIVPLFSASIAFPIASYSPLPIVPPTPPPPFPTPSL